MTEPFNVTIYTSAHYYRPYLIAFFLNHFKNAVIHEWANITPDIYIHCIVAYTITGDEIKKNVKPHTKVISISGEPFGMNVDQIQLGIHCCRQDTIPGTAPILYMPFYVVSFAERFAHPRELLIERDPKPILQSKSKFCAYMYSNPVPERDQFFDAICKYKPADALGSCRNANGKTRGDTSRYLYDLFVKTHYEDAVEQYKPYKFVIAMENSRIRGYVTEKLVNPVLAQSIPIYLGPPDLFDDGVLNPKAMIHIADFPSYEACVEYVKKVDQTPELYMQYIKEPIFIGNKLPDYFNSNYILPHVLKLFGK